MTIRLENLTIDRDDDSWALDLLRHGATDITNDETRLVDMLSVVRHILRERSDCTMVPVIRGAVLFSEGVNEYGHNGEVEVTYDHKGHRAIYGVHFGGRVTNVQCYMD